MHSMGIATKPKIIHQSDGMRLRGGFCVLHEAQALMPWVVCVLQAIVKRPSRCGFDQVQQGPSKTIALA
jgi:hypothetical protein